MSWAAVLGILGALATALFVIGDQKPMDREAETRRADVIAETLLEGHRAAEVWMAAHQGYSGDVPLVADGRSFAGLAACAAATRVATWSVEQHDRSGAVATALRRRYAGWPGAGISDRGLVSSGSLRIVTLPCEIPERAPVVVTGLPG